jgi:P2 family phage contractile tail tube protein
MALPKKLKFFNLFNDGGSYLHEVAELVLPKLARKMEDYRAGGMDTPIKTDMGGEALQCEWTCAGIMEDALNQYGSQKHDAVALRFAGSYQAEDGAPPKAVEVVMRGRHSLIDMGNAKSGDETTFKVTTELSYYKLTIDGKELIEIDALNMINKVDGVDILADHRSAIGI